MTAFDFPSPPPPLTVGQVSNGYTWDGEKWTLSSATVPGSAAGIVTPPQGRITLTSGVAVMQASVAGASTVYFTPYGGNLMPIYDGANMLMTAFAELSQLTTDTGKSPAAVAASKIYDLFVWNDGGTIRCTRGPAWTNAATRGYTFTLRNGIALNTSPIGNGPAALRGTWVGTIASNATATIDWIYGAAGANGVAGVFNVWNAFNRVGVSSTVIDNSASYTYTPLTIRQAHASPSMQISFVTGAQEDAVFASYQCYIYNATGAGAVYGKCGLGFDSTTIYASNAFNLGSVTGSIPVAVATWNAAAGSHILYALESGDGVNANNFNQNGVTNNVGLNFMFRM